VSAAFQSEVFWSAFGALVAFAALCGPAVAGTNALLKGRRRDRLQGVLDKERQFYENHARRVFGSKGPLHESMADRYIRDIRDGLTTIRGLNEQQRAATKLRELISQLRATHAALVKSLKLFTTNDAVVFFAEFDKFNQDFGEIYDTGNIPHDARTHCDDVVELVNKLADQLAPNGWHPIRNSAHSMQAADQDIIVPVMLELLGKTEVELSLISAAIRDKEFEKALWLKERYRFDVKHVYARLDAALTEMNELRSQI
jgi:hypothetical protein